MSDEDRFLNTAREESGQSVSVVGSTLIASAVGVKSRVSARTITTIIRGTTKLDEGMKKALVSAMDMVEADKSLGDKDRQDATNTIDQLREELSESPPDAKRVKRFVNTLSVISEPAATPLREYEPIRAMLAG
jgi:hypothetical protein